MNRITGLVLVVLVSLGLVNRLGGSVWAESPSLLIVAVQTGGTSSASEEYIELVNVSAQSQSVDQVYIEYYPASTTSFTKPTRRVKLSGSIPVGKNYVLTTNDYTERPTDLTFSPTLAAAGGHLRLVGPNGELDMVSWGTAQQGSPAPAPLPGQPMLRQNQNGTYVDTGNSQHDFASGPVREVVAIGLSLSEVLPDPAAPALDSIGEYVELGNSTSHDVSMKGWKITVGAVSAKTYVLPDQVLTAGAYLALYAPQTKLSLSNSSSTVRLINPEGQTADELTYPKAVTGSAWAWASGQWQWTTSPTPNNPNQVTTFSPDQVVGKASQTKNTAKKTAKAPKAKTKKNATAKAKTGQVDAAATVNPVVAGEQPKPTLHNAVIAGVGGLAVLYGAYEYRYDVINLYLKFRGNRKTR